MNSFFSNLTDLLNTNFPDDLDGKTFLNEELTISINPSAIKKIIEFLSDNSECQFKTLIDITAVDFPSRKVRFDVVYHLLSMAQNKRVRISC